MELISKGFKEEIATAFNNCLTQVDSKYDFDQTDKKFAKAVSQSKDCDIVKGIKKAKAQRLEDK
jgi:hypothetical protein